MAYQYEGAEKIKGGVRVWLTDGGEPPTRRAYEHTGDVTDAGFQQMVKGETAAMLAHLNAVTPRDDLTAQFDPAL